MNNIKERIGIIVGEDRLALLLQECGIKWPEKCVKNLVKNFDIAFENCKTRKDQILRLQEFNQFITSYFIRSTVKKEELDLTEDEIECLVDEDILCNCKNVREATKCLQEIAITKEVANLLKEAGLNISYEYVKKLAQEYENVFHACKTREDAIYRLCELSSVISLLEDAGLNWPAEYAINLALDQENVFHGCKTREDAIQRLRELSSVVKL